MTLSEKLELELQEDGFIELLAVQQEELTSADLMELRKRKNEERQEEEEVIEEPKGFRMQEMARGIFFFLSEEAMLVLEEQDLNAEWYTKVATTLQKAIQCYHIIHDEKKNNNNNKELVSRHLWIAFPKGR